HRLDPDVAALAAVAAVGAAVLDVLLAPERHRPAPAGAGLHVDLDLVEELHGLRGRISYLARSALKKGVHERHEPHEQKVGITLARRNAISSRSCGSCGSCGSSTKMGEAPLARRLGPAAHASQTIIRVGLGRRSR